MKSACEALSYLYRWPFRQYKPPRVRQEAATPRISFTLSGRYRPTEYWYKNTYLRPKQSDGWCISADRHLSSKHSTTASVLMGRIFTAYLFDARALGTEVPRAVRRYNSPDPVTPL